MANCFNIPTNTANSSEACPVIVTSECVYYVGSYLPNIKVGPNDTFTTILQKIDQSIGITSGVQIAYTSGQVYAVGTQVMYDTKLWEAVNHISVSPIAFNHTDWKIIINKEFSGTSLERRAIVDFPYPGQPFWDTDLMMPLYFKKPNWYNSAGGRTI